MTVSNKIRISWSGIDTNIVKQEIYYSKDNGNFQLLDTVSGSQNYLVIDTTKFPNGVYKFQVKLTDSIGNIFNTTTDSYTFSNTVVTSQATITATTQSVAATSQTSQTSMNNTTSSSASTESTTESSTVTTDSSLVSTSKSTSSIAISTDTSVSTETVSSNNQLISIQDNYIYIGDRKLPQALGIAMVSICCISLLIIILPWVFFFISERRNKTVIRERKI